MKIDCDRSLLSIKYQAYVTIILFNDELTINYQKLMLATDYLMIDST